jgi:hypothetical protein
MSVPHISNDDPYWVAEAQYNDGRRGGWFSLGEGPIIDIEQWIYLRLEMYGEPAEVEDGLIEWSGKHFTYNIRARRSDR